MSKIGSSGTKGTNTGVSDRAAAKKAGIPNNLNKLLVKR